MRGLKREEEEAQFDAEFGLTAVASKASPKGSVASPAVRRDQLRRSVDDLAREAFPYAVVADSYRIGKLVDRFEPSAISAQSERVEAARRKRDERTEKAKRLKELERARVESAAGRARTPGTPASAANRTKTATTVASFAKLARKRVA